MISKIAFFFKGIALCLALSANASAEVVYVNGALNGKDYGALTINDGVEVSNSFILSTPTDLKRAEVGLWTYQTTPISVDWSIGSSPFSANFGSGQVNFINFFQGVQQGDIYNVFLSNFALDIFLPAGNYWLTLQNAVAEDGQGVYWDINLGPSLAQQRTTRFLSNVSSQYFALFSDAIDIPEPTTVALLGLGLLGLVASRHKSGKTENA